MKIFHYQLNLIDPFGISRGTRSQSDVVLVNVDGGWGESCPLKYYKEDVQTVHRTLDQISEMELRDLDYIDDYEAALNASIAGNQSAKAAVDIALHDRLGKKLGAPLYKLFGRSPDRVMITSFTIGIDTMEEMLRKVDAAREYSILKIKLGRSLEHDLAVMREIRKAVGGKTLRVDANGGWTLEEARQALPVMKDLGVEYVEQPLERGRIAELRELKKTAPLPIFVDEDSMTASDLPALVGATDGINIKLMKSGGLSEARRMVALARTYGLQIMIGCMIETSVAITAAAHLSPFADYLDLDGNLLVSNDPFTGVRYDPDGRMYLPDTPGLGVTPKPEYAEQFSDR